jgi:hypothetical protein
MAASRRPYGTDLGTTEHKALDRESVLWDIPTMSTSTADARKRVVLPRARPGEVYAIEQQAEGRFLVTRLEKPVHAERPSRAACLRALREAPLRPTTSWEELRKLTREL